MKKKEVNSNTLYNSMKFVNLKRNTSMGINCAVTAMRKAFDTTASCDITARIPYHAPVIEMEEEEGRRWIKRREGKEEVEINICQWVNIRSTQEI